MLLYHNFGYLEAKIDLHFCNTTSKSATNRSYVNPVPLKG